MTFETVGPLSRDEEKCKKALKMKEDGSRNAASRMKELNVEHGPSDRSKMVHFAVTSHVGVAGSGCIGLGEG